MVTGDLSATPTNVLPRKAEECPSGPGTPWLRWCSWLYGACSGKQKGRLPRLGLTGAALTWMRSGQGPLGDSRAAVPSALQSPPRPRRSPCQPAASSGGFPGAGSASARGGARRRTTRPTPPAAASRLCALGPRLQSSLRRPPVTLRGRTRGAGVGTRGLQSLPSPQSGQGI